MIALTIEENDYENDSVIIQITAYDSTAKIKIFQLNDL